MDNNNYHTNNCAIMQFKAESDTAEPHSTIINTYDTKRFDLYSAISNIPGPDHDCSVS